MVADKITHLEIKLDALDLNEQYLLSMATGLPLTKEFRGYFQKYINAVIEVAEELGIESHGRIKGIVLGASLEMALKIRSKAFNRIAAENDEFSDIKLKREHAYHDDVDLLFKKYKVVLNTINPAKQALFEELTREWFCLHGAMMLKGATGLRKFHLQQEELDEKKVVEHFKIGLDKFKVDHFA